MDSGTLRNGMCVEIDGRKYTSSPDNQGLVPYTQTLSQAWHAPASPMLTHAKLTRSLPVWHVALSMLDHLEIPKDSYEMDQHATKRNLWL